MIPFLYIFAVIGLIAALIVAAALTENERFGWATLMLVASVVIAQCLQVLDILTFVRMHAGVAILYVVAYIVVGVLWSFVKWFSFLMTARDRYRKWKSDFLVAENLTCIPADRMSDFKLFIINRCGYGYRDPIADLIRGKRPQAVNNKSRIIFWMSLWPCSALGTLLNDPVRRLCSYLFNAFKAMYQKLSDRLFARDTELD
jgi:hypothetical protein